ncbi:MAG: Uma2 family endonuclease [Lachnospiraceae bacterium]|nr:Uma2 family endonuclease [Lachnospiraceae bacterium]
MTIDEMRRIKKEKGYSYQMLSDLSGVPVGTMQKIFRGETESPRYETLHALEKALSGNVNQQSPNAVYESSSDYDTADCGNFGNSPSNVSEVRGNSPSNISEVRESAPHYCETLPKKQQGEYTMDDFYALPEDQRWELIDGYLFEMNSPTSYHQLIAGEVYRQIANFIIHHDGDCTPFIYPMDVQLDRDNRTMVEPDVIIMCDPDQITARNLVGAPDFVLEVLSPSTRKRDLKIKLSKYEQAGVREYWVVDPYQRVVLFYFFESSEYMTIYPIDAEIPVNIYEGELKISLTRVLKWLPEK